MPFLLYVMSVHFYLMSKYLYVMSLLLYVMSKYLYVLPYLFTPCLHFLTSCLIISIFCHYFFGLCVNFIILHQFSITFCPQCIKVCRDFLCYANTVLPYVKMFDIMSTFNILCHSITSLCANTYYVMVNAFATQMKDKHCRDKQNLYFRFQKLCVQVRIV